jgi:hypothetical protein
MDCQIVRTEIHVEPTNTAIHTHLQGCERCARYAERMARLDGILRPELVAIAPTAVTARLQALSAAPARPVDRLERAVRDELLMSAPAALTARLQALVPEPARVPSALDTVLREALVVQAPPELTARLQALVPSAVPVPSKVPVVHRSRQWVVAAVYFATAALLLLSLMYAGQVYSLMIAQLGLGEWLSQIGRWPADMLDQLYAVVPQARVVVGVLVRLQQPLQWLLAALVLWAVIDMSQQQGSHEQQSARGRQYA